MSDEDVPQKQVEKPIIEEEKEKFEPEPEFQGPDLLISNSPEKLIKDSPDI